ncbi:unnamed protein product [Lampetra planeri]
MMSACCCAGRSLHQEWCAKPEEEVPALGGHKFRVRTLRRPKPCGVCRQLVSQHATSCRTCKFTCHRKCESKYTPQTATALHTPAHGTLQSQRRVAEDAVTAVHSIAFCPPHPPPPNSHWGVELSMEGGRDLELTYITERIISLCAPTAGDSHAYHQQMQDVARMLHSKHANGYLVINLSERRYDIEKFNVHVKDFGWPDLHAPPLDVLCSICKAMDSWLNADPAHVVVIHCKGNKCRTGVVVASYMYYNGICASASQALDRYAMKKFYDDKVAKLSQPSQRRYVSYFSELLSGRVKVNNLPLFLHHIVIHGLPNLEDDGGCRPFLKIYQAAQPLHTSAVYNIPDNCKKLCITIEPGLPLKGDILVKCYHRGCQAATRDEIFRVQFHTCVVQDFRPLVLGKAELDAACTDEKFPDDGRVEFIFSSGPEKPPGGERYMNAADIGVDFGTADPLIRCDSYENFNVRQEDSLEEVPHTEGPVDGSLYARIKKKGSSDSGTAVPSVNGISAAAAAACTAPAGASGSSSAIRQGQHNRSMSTDSGNSTASTKTERIMMEEHHHNSTNLSANAATISTPPVPAASANAAASTAATPSMRGGSVLSGGPRDGLVLPPGSRHVVPVQVHVNGDRATPERETDILDDDVDGGTFYGQPNGSLYGNPVTLGAATKNGAGFGTPQIPERSNSSRHAVQRTVSSWQSHSRPLTRQQSDVTYDRPTAVWRGAAGSASASPHGGPAPGFPDLRAQEDFERSLLELNKLIQELDPTFKPLEPPDHLTTSPSAMGEPQIRQQTTVQSKAIVGGTSFRGAPGLFLFHQNGISHQVVAGYMASPHAQEEVFAHHSQAALYMPRSGAACPRPGGFLSSELKDSDEYGWFCTHHPPKMQPGPPQSDWMDGALRAPLHYSSPQEALPPTPAFPVCPPTPYINQAMEFWHIFTCPVMYDCAGVVFYFHLKCFIFVPCSLSLNSQPGSVSPGSPGYLPSSSERGINSPNNHGHSLSMAYEPPAQSFKSASYHHSQPTYSGSPVPHGSSSVGAMPTHGAYSGSRSPGHEVSRQQSSPLQQQHPSSPGWEQRQQHHHPLLLMLPERRHLACGGSGGECGGFSPSCGLPNGEPASPASPLSSGPPSLACHSPPPGLHSASPPTFSRHSSLASLPSDGSIETRAQVKFVQDTTKYWYKKEISRDQAIALLKDKEPGSFVIRDSHSFRGAYGLAMKVSSPPPNIPQQGKKGDVSSELVRHYLIECTSKGVRLKGCPNEPYFGSLSALVYQHSITPLALPCKIVIPHEDPLEHSEVDSIQLHPLNATPELLKQGAACNVLYLGSVEMESLTGPQAVAKAVGQALAGSAPPSPTQVHFKVSQQGVTLTDNQRKLFFRRHYPADTVTYCDQDPQNRKWKKDSGSSANIFGFVAKKQGSVTDNQCHLFAELDPKQPASAIVSFITKVMMSGQGSAPTSPVPSPSP